EYERAQTDHFRCSFILPVHRFFRCTERGISRIYDALEIKPTVIVPRDSRAPRQLTIKNQHIASITQSLDIPDGSRRLRKLIEYLTYFATGGGHLMNTRKVGSLIDLKWCGRLDLQQTWETYMVTGSTKKNSAARLRSNLDKQIVDLRDKLHGWCVDGHILELHHNRKSWQEKKMMELGDLKPTHATVELAFNFKALSMLWRSYRTSFSIAFQLAIFQHVLAIPEKNYETLKRLAGDDSKNLQVILAFYSCMASKKRGISYDALSFQTAMKAILPKPYQVEMFNFPTLTDFMIGSSSREYFMIAELVRVCQDVGPTMIKEPDLFWRQLEAVSFRDDILPLMKVYQKACQYFKNGAPFDKAFEYYELVTSIAHELKQLDHSETQKIRGANSDYKLPSAMLTQQSTLIDAIESNDSQDKIVQEKLESLMRGKLNLAMNYAEEFYQEQRSVKAARGVFRPAPRARRDQLHDIARLFRDLMTPQYVIKGLDEVDYKINHEVVNTRLPTLIKTKVSAFTVVFQQEVKIHVAKRSRPKNPGLSSAGQSGRFWSRMLSEAFSQAKWDDQKIIPDDALLSSTPSLQNDPVIWEGIRSTVEREFATMNSANADTLIGCLSRVHAYLVRRDISHRIFHVMRKANESEKNSVLQWVQEKLNELQESQEKFIKPHEHGKLKQTLELIKLHSKEGCPTAIWEQTISPKISDLPIDLAMVLDELFADLPHRFAADLVHERLEREVKPQLSKTITQL
ncbi:hypothetical protein PSTT_02601, partial [Puccinia striiformis]